MRKTVLELELIVTLPSPCSMLPSPNNLSLPNGELGSVLQSLPYSKSLPSPPRGKSSPIRKFAPPLPNNTSLPPPSSVSTLDVLEIAPSAGPTVISVARTRSRLVPSVKNSRAVGEQQPRRFQMCRTAITWIPAASSWRTVSSAPSLA